jgi:hypothetical protein
VPTDTRRPQERSTALGPLGGPSVLFNPASRPPGLSRSRPTPRVGSIMQAAFLGVIAVLSSRGPDEAGTRRTRGVFGRQKSAGLTSGTPWTRRGSRPIMRGDVGGVVGSKRGIRSYLPQLSSKRGDVYVRCRSVSVRAGCSLGEWFVYWTIRRIGFVRGYQVRDTGGGRAGTRSGGRPTRVNVFVVRKSVASVAEIG